MSVETTTPTTVAINGNPLPGDLVEALDDGRWMDFSAAAGQLISARFGTRTLYPDLYGYVRIVRATDFFASDAGSGYWHGGLDRTLDMDPTKSVLIGDLVGAADDFLALDYRAGQPVVRFLTNDGWVQVAASVTELIAALEA